MSLYLFVFTFKSHTKKYKLDFKPCLNTLTMHFPFVIIELLPVTETGPLTTATTAAPQSSGERLYLIYLIS